MQRVQSGSSRTGSGGITASVKTDVNLTLGPNAGVRITLLTPNVPGPARNAAWRCEKNASGRSFRMLMWP